MGLKLREIGLWTYPAKPPEEPYAYILVDKGIIYNPNSLMAILEGQVKLQRA
jgi:hypothetical protein